MSELITPFWINEAAPAVHTTHSRVAQGAQAIHSLWNLRLVEVTHRTIKTEVETCCFTNYFCHLVLLSIWFDLGILLLNY